MGLWPVGDDGVLYHAENLGEIAAGVPPNSTKTCFLCVWPMQTTYENYDRPGRC